MNYPADYDIAQLKIPPHSIQAEQAVLGALMLPGTVFDNIGDLIASDFYRPDHQAIFNTIVRLIDEGKAVDYSTVADRLGANLEQIGGYEYLIDLVRSTPSTANLSAYAEAVRERAQFRALIRIGAEIVDNAYNPDNQTSLDLIDQAQATILALGDKTSIENTQLNPILKEVVDEIDRRFNSEDELTGLSTGFIDIDKRTNGLQKGDLILVAARPSMGKTCFAMNIVEHVVTNLHQSVLVFSMEMPKIQLIQRMISSCGRIALKNVQTGKLLDDEWPKLSLAVSKLKDKKLFIDDRSALTIRQIRSSARRHHKKNKLSLIVIDYVQLAAGIRDESREQEISKISRGLKSLAKELNIPLIALSQLNRKVEDRPDKHPRNADLRDSGGLEQDADIIFMLYRDEYYKADSDRKGIAEIDCTKFRNGETGKDYLATQFHQARFENLAYEMRPVEEAVKGRKANFEY